MLIAGLVFLSMLAGMFTQQEPRVLLQHLPFETLLYKTYPELTKPEPTVYVFEGLREVRAPRQAERWLEEMRVCLVSEGKEIREHTSMDETKFYQYAAAWSMKNHRATELRGVWFVESIATHDVLDSSMLEQTIRHEMVHHLIGLTYHPLTPKIVGRCMPILLMDERKDKDAGSTKPSRALPPGFRGIRGQRVGPGTLGRDGVLGSPRVFVEPQRCTRGAGILSKVCAP